MQQLERTLRNAGNIHRYSTIVKFRTDYNKNLVPKPFRAELRRGLHMTHDFSRNHPHADRLPISPMVGFNEHRVVLGRRSIPNTASLSPQKLWLERVFAGDQNMHVLDQHLVTSRFKENENENQWDAVFKKSRTVPNEIAWCCTKPIKWRLKALSSVSFLHLNHLSMLISFHFI